MDELITNLSHLGIIEISGADSDTFVNAQFTGDINEQVEYQIKPCAWCNPKGQVVTTFLLLRLKNRFLLITPLELTDRFCDWLQTYIFRSAVIIKNQTGKYQCAGFIGEKAIDNLQAMTNLQLPGPYQAVDYKDTLIATMAGHEATRALVIEQGNNTGSTIKHFQNLIELVDAKIWKYYDIRDGLPWILEKTSEQFLPQELNLDLIGGLSFDKGCYPGQEVVARVYFRQKLKNRMCLARLDTDSVPEPGSKIFCKEMQSSSGIIINLEPNNNKTVWMLAVINIEQAEKYTLFAGSPDGPRLTLTPLPY